MGYYGITGWSGGGRRPINYGLKAGQFRTGKYNIFENKTVINNNVFTGGYMGGYNYGCYNTPYCNNSTPSWMKWMMGLGIGTSFLGGILSMFGGMRNSEAGGVTDSQDETDVKRQPKDKDPLAGLKEAFPDGKFVKITDNLYQGTVDGKTYDGTSIEDLYKNIKNGTTQKATPNPTSKGPTENGNLQSGNQNNNDEDVVKSSNDNTSLNTYSPRGSGNSASPQGWYRSQNANSNSYQFSLEELKNHTGANSSVDLIVNTFSTNAPNIDTAKLREALIKKNPSVFAADGNLKDGADITKLDIPTYKWINENCLKTAASEPAPATQSNKIGKQIEEDGGIKIKYNNSANYIYKKNGISSIDDDAIFVIDGHKYTLSKGDGQFTSTSKKLDYGEITEQRTLGADIKLIDTNTGKFNPDGFNTAYYKTKTTFFVLRSEDTNSPLNGAIISRNEQGQVIIIKDGKSALIDDVMSQNIPLK